MIVYKFYKPDCTPCYVLSRILKHIAIPKDITFINLNIEDEENKTFAKENNIDKIPSLMFSFAKVLFSSLMFSNGVKIIGLKTEEEIVKFLNRESNYEISN